MKGRGAPHGDLAEVRALVPRALVHQLAVCAGVLLRVQLHIQAPQVRRERLSRRVQMQRGCLQASKRLYQRDPKYSSRTLGCRPAIMRTPQKCKLCIPTLQHLQLSLPINTP